MDPQLPIRSLDYTVVFARNMPAMREFYGATLGFPLHRELSSKWLEFRIGSNLLALTEHGAVFDDPAPPPGALSLQMAFRVAPAEVATCAAVLMERGVTIIPGRPINLGVTGPCSSAIPTETSWKSMRRSSPLDRASEATQSRSAYVTQRRPG